MLKETKFSRIPLLSDTKRTHKIAIFPSKNSKIFNFFSQKFSVSPRMKVDSVRAVVDRWPKRSEIEIADDFRNGDNDLFGYC